MEQEFYASIKLISGEEIFAIVSPSDEEDRTLLLLENPVIIEPIMKKTIVIGYKIRPWMLIPDDDIYIIDMNKVITMTEIHDRTIIRMYEKFNKNSSQVSLDKNMGLISKVDDARKMLEELYKK
jgi:hypothetical protein